MKNSMLQQLDSQLENLCAAGVRDGVFPGVAAGIAMGGKGRRRTVVRVAGTTRIGQGKGKRVERTTLFDLASLTKPLATALVLFSLADRRLIGLNDPLSAFFDPEAGWEKDVDLDMLLTHSAGLTPYRPYFERFRPRVAPDCGDALLQMILSDPLEYLPGTDCRYSDLGYILLGRVIGQVTGMDLAECFRRHISVPLGLDMEIFYLPVTGPGEDVGGRSVAATEDCPWRGRILQGEVHDEHCWLMNGISGHAGLFGTIDGVLTLCAHILDQWQGRGELYGGDILQRALRRKYRNHTWCRGFDTPSAVGSSGGTLLSRASVGHLGYTGTSFWIDPDREVIVVLLSNRVHPDRKNKKIRRFRPLFHDALMRTVVQGG